MATTMQLTGFRELERALSELPRATGKNVLRRIARGALEPLADAAAAAAPEQSGRLSFSISVSEQRTSRARWQRMASASGIAMAMGPAGGLGVLPYAAFAEFGTIDTPPHPFMRPTWDAGGVGALEYVKANLGAEIARAAARVARKAARAGRG